MKCANHCNVFQGVVNSVYFSNLIYMHIRTTQNVAAGHTIYRYTVEFEMTHVSEISLNVMNHKSLATMHYLLYHMVGHLYEYKHL